MYCRQCGAQNQETSPTCARCGQVLYKPILGTGIQVPNYLVQAILVTCFCCMPFGIASIVYAAQVNGKVGMGDIEGAQQASKAAKMWCWIAFGVGFGWMVLWGLFTFLPFLLVLVMEAAGPH